MQFPDEDIRGERDYQLLIAFSTITVMFIAEMVSRAHPIIYISKNPSFLKQNTSFSQEDVRYKFRPNQKLCRAHICIS